MSIPIQPEPMMFAVSVHAALQIAHATDTTKRKNIMEVATSNTPCASTNIPESDTEINEMDINIRAIQTKVQKKPKMVGTRAFENPPQKEENSPSCFDLVFIFSCLFVYFGRRKIVFFCSMIFKSLLWIMLYELHVAIIVFVSYVV